MENTYLKIAELPYFILDIGSGIPIIKHVSPAIEFLEAISDNDPRNKLSINTRYLDNVESEEYKAALSIWTNYVNAMPKYDPKTGNLS